VTPSVRSCVSQSLLFAKAHSSLNSVYKENK
jgi:hypothetical protein